MRLDLFLKASRLSPRRTVAQKLCGAGQVRVNNRVAKASHTVKADDEITIRRGYREMTVKVVDIPSARQISRNDATSLYELIGEKMIDEDDC